MFLTTQSKFDMDSWMFGRPNFATIRDQHEMKYVTKL